MVSERPSIRTWLECWKNSFPRLPRLLRFFVAGIHGTAQLGCSRHQWLCLQGQTFWNEASWQLKLGRNGWKDMSNWTDHEKRWKRCLNLLENESDNWLKQVHAKYATTRTWLSRTRSEPKIMRIDGNIWGPVHSNMFCWCDWKPEMCRKKRRKVGNRKSEPNSDESQVMKMSIESALCFRVGSSLSIAWTCCRFVPIRSYVALWSCDCKVPTMPWGRCIGQKSVRTSTRRFEQIGVHIGFSVLFWV